MVWALLALLGIPIWFIVILLVAALRNRRSVRNDPEVFRFKSRTAKGWKRRPEFGRWVSDVLIVHSGIALIRTTATAIDEVDELAGVTPGVKGLGDDVVALRLGLRDDSEMEIAVPAADVGRAAGPYRTAG